MKRYIILFLILFQIIVIKKTSAQKEVFGIGGIIGINFSLLSFEQPIGNEQSYNNNGLVAGICCNADINRHYNVKMEILYSRNGAYINPESVENIQYGKIKLNYIEVPFHFDYYINSYKSTKFLPDWAIEMGGAYANLFSYHIEDIDKNDITKQTVYNYKSVFLFQLGSTVYFFDHFGGNIRFSIPFLPAENKPGLTTAIRLIYRLYD